jgi:hypothetical protein
MIAMRADAMTGGYWDCHDVSSVLAYGNLYGGKKNCWSLPLYMTKRATIQSSEAN